MVSNLIGFGSNMEHFTNLVFYGTFALHHVILTNIYTYVSIYIKKKYVGHGSAAGTAGGVRRRAAGVACSFLREREAVQLPPASRRVSGPTFPPNSVPRAAGGEPDIIAGSRRLV